MIDYKQTVPLYKVIYNTLKERIRCGEYSPGVALPSEPKLREEFGVSTITVRRAIHELALDGLVEPRQGLGNIVRDPSSGPVVVRMSSFTTDVAGGRLRLMRTLLTDDMVPASADVAHKLGVQEGSMLRHLVRLDSEGNAPLSTDEVFIAPSLAAKITKDIAASPVFMHLWQEASGLELVQTRYDIWVEMPNSFDQHTILVSPECPVLVTGELIFDASGNPAAWIVSRYRGDRSRLSGTVMLHQRKTAKGVIGE